MTLTEWLASALGDAERRRLPDLPPILEALARTAAALRAASWNLDPSGQDASRAEADAR